ncbi:MAG: DUF3098 domain-containing protein [Flavobacteriales bacterium]|jgi:hypothetical protein|nr:DUF3098 domain-containing protein [Bacteroidota bacterium]MDP4588130.1 DUF3098 domain-containing protein [Flavobacteriales bacterium]MDP4954239.1 DUF3098 domain-containing protein [Flavobacteriales bacterium]
MKNKSFAFQRQNYLLLIAGLVVVILGFIVMSGGGSEDPNEFSEEIFSFRRITLAPIMVLGGYGLVMYAIMKKPKADHKQEA